MGPIEIFLISVGLIIVIATYVISNKFELGDNQITEEIDDKVKLLARELAKDEVERELAENIDYKLEEFEIAIDKIVNEKMMAMGEYSDNIMSNIEKNHEEVMFLYNMLNEKEAVLKDTIRDIETIKQSVKKMAVMEDAMAEAKVSVAKSRTEEKNKEQKQKEEKTHITREERNKKIINEPMLNGKINKNQEILKLSSEGMTNMEIAKQLGIGIGEVRLVIDLFRKEG